MKRSPGQKRKLYVQIICLLLFSITTYFGAQFYGKVSDDSLAWTKDSYQVNGVVTDLVSEEEEYRNRKGRKRTRTIYYVTYNLELQGDVYEQVSKIKSREFDNLEVGQEIAVIVANDDSMFDLKSAVERELTSNNFVSNVISVGVFSAPASFFIYYILSFMFVREAANAMPEGFFNEHSWLDIDDNDLVWLFDNAILTVSFDKKYAKRVQSAYQKGESFEEITSLIYKPNIKQINFEDIIEVESRHNSDTISISTEKTLTNVEFLNQAVKTHALERFLPKFPEHLQHSVNKKTRLMAALPWLSLALIGGAVIFYFGTSIISTVVGFFVLIKVLPKLIARTISPTIVQLWEDPKQDGQTV